ncbi:unnamed protein product [Rangifer tarandus platyrhynchus]|uniref:Uncharacterized protein n=1 Tax=Rangifer tarandus platyrhynchus TaxID=3082113 RepID=A0AC59YL81_RANTA
MEVSRWRYLNRFSSKLEQIELRNSFEDRQGRRHCSREAAIRQTLERERWQYQAHGLEILDILNADNLKTFRGWDFDLKKLPNIKMRKAVLAMRCPRSVRRKL